VVWNGEGAGCEDGFPLSVVGLKIVHMQQCVKWRFFLAPRSRK
jgi:hypothetical protein